MNVSWGALDYAALLGSRTSNKGTLHVGPSAKRVCGNALDMGWRKKKLL